MPAEASSSSRCSRSVRSMGAVSGRTTAAGGPRAPRVRGGGASRRGEGRGLDVRGGAGRGGGGGPAGGALQPARGGAPAEGMAEVGGEGSDVGAGRAVDGDAVDEQVAGGL